MLRVRFFYSQFKPNSSFEPVEYSMSLYGQNIDRTNRKKESSVPSGTGSHGLIIFYRHYVPSGTFDLRYFINSSTALLGK